MVLVDVCYGNLENRRYTGMKPCEPLNRAESFFRKLGGQKCCLSCNLYVDETCEALPVVYNYLGSEKTNKGRLGEVLVARKFDLSASGTHLLCFYSSISLVPGEFWLIRNLGSKFARIFCLWFNSTPNLVQMFLNRTETRGAWMKTDISSLKEMYLIDPRTLTENEEEELLESFEVMANCELPSIVEQLRTMHHVRKKVDMMILKIIGFEGSEIESMLSYLYPALANEIEKLKTLMEG